jgi:23S rRNA (pseudouridine1915-N3)-methyltransferase
MRLHIVAMGRVRAGPERALIDDYVQRADRTGRALSLGPVQEQELDDRKATTMAEQGRALLRAIPEGARVVALDERGTLVSSRALAQMLAQVRDGGAGDLAFVIGGADGLDPSVRARADTLLSFGPMVWPHMLARVMLAEQLYRATSILAGAPYHRD